MKVQIKANTKTTLAALRRLGERGMVEIKAATAKAAIAVQTFAKQNCPVDTGRLRSSIAIAMHSTGLSASVGTNVEYGPAVEFGHPAYTIRPKTKSVLSWVGKDGQRYFAKSVTIPARAARPFLFPAWEQVRPVYLKMLRDGLQRASAAASA